MNSIAECSNLTFMTATIASLNYSWRPLNLWKYAILYAVKKYNLLPNTATGDSPHSRWHVIYTPIPLFIPFGTIGTVPIDAKNTKLKSRAMTCWYMYTFNTTQIIVSSRTIRERTKCVWLILQLLRLDAYPITVLSKAISTRKLAPPSTSIDPETPPPAHISTTCWYTDAQDWLKADNAEIEQLKIRNLSAGSIPHHYRHNSNLSFSR